jgi:hypothetical protein
MLPKKIVILGDTVTIKQVDDAQMDAFNGRSDETLGLAMLLDDAIAIRKTCPIKSKKLILLHEIFHIALYKSGVSQGISAEIEEVLCQNFARLFIELKRQGL